RLQSRSAEVPRHFCSVPDEVPESRGWHHEHNHHHRAGSPDHDDNDDPAPAFDHHHDDDPTDHDHLPVGLDDDDHDFGAAFDHHHDPAAGTHVQSRHGGLHQAGRRGPEGVQVDRDGSRLP